MKKLNLGCGRDIRKGYVNLDCKKNKGVDVVHDLDKFPYPFKASSFDVIICYNVLEHLDDLGKVMKELHRILKKNRHVLIRVPHFTYSGAYADPTHKHFFSYCTFDYFTAGSDFKFYFDFTFKILKKKIVFGKKFQFWNYPIEFLVNLLPSVYENSFLRIMPALELEFVLKKE